jgi:hypothetical protein
MRKWVFLAGYLLAATLSLAAQDEKTRDSYDPLVPQLAAMDNKHNVFAVINGVDNTVDLMRAEGDELARFAVFTVDVVKKRHDTHHIYRPRSVAIYEEHVVVLASHRDSAFLAVLDLSGREVTRLRFAGSANAFSYSPEARELYISGENPEGYNVAALDASEGMERLSLEQASTRHYRKPKMAEQIKQADPLGIGMAMVAMSVVFLGLLLLYLGFKQVGRVLVARHRSRGHERVTGAPAGGEDAVHVAIAAAIHLYNEELHDEEKTVLTINRVSRAYSPWSSKIHGLNTYFNKK